MGVWIEIGVRLSVVTFLCQSLPVWECGLKYGMECFSESQRGVTPCMGVWIEIGTAVNHVLAASVTPCMGVWIEIFWQTLWGWLKVSLPVWECGLK